MIPVVIDTDPGIDDAVALAYAALCLGDRLRGITVTYGNCSVDWAARNAALILELCHAPQVPVVKGAAAPFCRPAELATDTHGADGLGEARKIVDVADVEAQAAARLPAREHAAEDLVTWAREAAQREKMILIALGPLTNLALALALDRRAMVAGCERVVIMGGSAGAPGNTTPVAEFNFWADPEAAQAVFASGLPITMVGLDATRTMLLRQSGADRLRLAGERQSSRLLSLLACALQSYIDFHRRHEGLEGCILNDPLAVLLAVRPDLAVCPAMHVEIQGGHGATRGQSVCDRYGFGRQEANARVIMQVDGPACMLRVWQALAPGVLTEADCS